MHDIFQYDESIRKKGFRYIAGIDEAGRGPLAGPVVSAAVILKPDVKIDGLKDSKKLSESKREQLYIEIKNSSLDIGIGISTNDDIDRMNILKATKLSMQKAVESLSIKPDILIIDAVHLHSIDIKQIIHTKCESISASVAAASIIAKVTRDRIMKEYHIKYPQYNFIKHKGYSTKEHIRLIRQYGPCPIHRKSFFKVIMPELPFLPVGRQVDS
jgi:ribonuclease HII